MRVFKDSSVPVAIAVVVVVAALHSAPAALAQSAKSSLEDPVLAARFNSISDRLVCQCGCNMILRVCNHFECPSAVPMRKQIEEQLLAGMTDDAIVEGFVAEHGKVVLSAPPPEGVNLAAWVMPGFAILIGLFAVSYIVADWVARRKVKPAAVKTAVDSGLASRIEDELSKMDG